MESAACSFLQFPEIPPLRSGSRRVTAMLRNSPLNACDAFGGSWSGAESAMKTTAPILHRRAPAGCFAPCLRSTFRDRREIAGRVSVSQPSAPALMGSLYVFHDYPLPPGWIFPCSPNRQSPGRPDGRGRVRRRLSAVRFGPLASASSRTFRDTAASAQWLAPGLHRNPRTADLGKLPLPD